MVKRVKPNQAKSKFFTTFYVDFPVLFSISMKEDVSNKWKKHLNDRDIPIKIAMNKIFLSLFETSHWQEWRKKNKDVASHIDKRIKAEFRDYLGLDSNTLSRAMQEKIEGVLKENEE